MTRTMIKYRDIGLIVTMKLYKQAISKEVTYKTA